MKKFGFVINVALAIFGVCVASIILFFYIHILLSVGVLLLLVAVSFAIVGKGNRLLWLMISPVIFAVLIIVPYTIYEYLEKQGSGVGILSALLGFALIPVLPSLFLGAAHAIRLRRPNQS